MKRQILSRIKDELLKMKKSSDSSYIETIIPYDKGREFSVECIRCNEDDNIYDEDGNLFHSMNGRVIAFEVYYRVNGEYVDCCSLDSFLDKSNIKSLKEFVDMYR